MDRGLKTIATGSVFMRARSRYDERVALGGAEDLTTLQEHAWMGKHKPVPDVVALLVCDQIITDRLTGKQSLIGMFSKVHAVSLPATHPQLCIFVALTDGHGKVDLTLRIVDSNEARPPIVQGSGTVEFKDPRAIANLALQFHGLTFPEPGEYRVQLYCHDELLREARLELVKVNPRPRQMPTQQSGGDE